MKPFSQYLSLIAIVMLASLESAQGCQKAGGRWWLGGDTSAQWTLKPGEACTHSMTLNEGASVIHEIKIVTRAKTGVAGTNGHTNYGYQAAQNYVGHDHFEVMVTGERHGRRGQTRIKVDVDIRR